MKTVTITLGGKEYAALPLRMAEIEAGVQAFAKMRQASSPPIAIDTVAIEEAKQEVARIICNAIRRVDPSVDVDAISSEITNAELLDAFLRLKASGGVM